MVESNLQCRPEVTCAHNGIALVNTTVTVVIVTHITLGWFEYLLIYIHESVLNPILLQGERGESALTANKMAA